MANASEGRGHTADAGGQSAGSASSSSGVLDENAAQARGMSAGFAAERASAPAIEHASVRLEPPAASNEHVRKSMKGNKRANTKPELIMRKRLRAAGLGGYRLQWKVPGHPDVAWPGKKVALFVNGCFWHRCPHCHPATPKTHVEYWSVKFERNVERDKRTRCQLEEAGWKVHVVWECQLKKKTIDDTLDALFPQLARELGKELKAPDAEPAASENASAAPENASAARVRPEASAHAAASALSSDAAPSPRSSRSSG